MKVAGNSGSTFVYSIDISCCFLFVCFFAVKKGVIRPRYLTPKAIVKRLPNISFESHIFSASKMMMMMMMVSLDLQVDEDSKGYLTEEETAVGLGAINPNLRDSDMVYLFRVSVRQLEVYLKQRLRFNLFVQGKV